MEPNTSPPVDIKCEPDVNDLIPRFQDIGHDGSLHDAIIVIFDLDLTNISVRDREICQIAAQCNGYNFNQYMIPNRKITRSCTTYHGIKIKYAPMQSRTILYHNENEVNAVSQREGLELFLAHLNDQHGRVLLAANDCFRYNCYTIIRQMRNYNLIGQFQSVVVGFVDTLPIFRTLLPDRNQDKRFFKLKLLATDYLEQIPENLHAVTNVEILGLLMIRTGCTNAIMIQRAERLDAIMQRIPEDVDERTVGLQLLNVDISDAVIEKIAKAGISIDLLLSTYIANGRNGVEMLLGEIIEGKPRVKTNPRTIQSIITGLERLLLDNENAPDN